MKRYVQCQLSLHPTQLLEKYGQVLKPYPPPLWERKVVKHEFLPKKWDRQDGQAWPINHPGFLRCSLIFLVS